MVGYDEDTGPEVQAALDDLLCRITELSGLVPQRWVLLARSKEQAQRVGRPLVCYLRALLSEGDREQGDLRQLIERILVGETRFFRHPGQWALLRDLLIPERQRVCREERRPLRVWSAGCATGEEAYSLAMLIAAVGSGSGKEPEVIGTDLSRRALEIAERGRYSRAALLCIPTEFHERYLLESDAQEILIAPSLREEVAIKFHRHNLIEPLELVPFDIILCRNVLIYFADEAQRQVLARLSRSLVQGGHILLGPAESLRKGGDGLRDMLDIRQSDWGQRREDAPAPVDGAPRAVPSPLVLRLHGSYGDGERIMRELRPYLLHGRPLIVDMDDASYLGTEDARVLHRAREVLALTILASSPAAQRFLTRHRLVWERKERRPDERG